MYKVIGSVKTRAFRVMWMLEELGQTYDIIPAAPASDEARNITRQAKSLHWLMAMTY